MINNFKNDGMEFVEMPFYPHKKKLTDIFNASKIIYSTVSKLKVDIIHTHHRLPEFLAVQLSRFLKVPTVTTCHAIIQGKVSLSFLSKKIIGVSDAVKENLVNNFNFSPDRVEVISNIPREFGLPSKDDLSEFRDAHGINDENFIVAGIGRLHFEKGFDLFLKALNSEHGMKLTAILVGKGEEEQQLKKLVGENSANVIFISETENLDIIYSIADAIVVPSRMESYGLVPVEASFFEKAVIAANVGGLSQHITDGITGILVSPENPDEIIKAIKHLYFNPALKTQLGSNLKSSISKKYNSKKLLGQVVGVYTKALEEYAV